MKNRLEDWFLDSFIPGFTGISMYVGILTIFYIVSFGLNKLFGLDLAYSFVILIMAAFLVPDKIKEDRAKRES